MNSPSAALFIRRMTESDVDPVMELAASLEQASRWPRSAYLGALDPLAAPRRIAVVAEAAETGAITGFAVASVVEGLAELETIAVAPERRRQGMARRLFTALTAELRPAGAREFILEVRASNHPAQELYRSLGFAESGRRPRYYHDPVEDAVLMNLPLENCPM
jgi:ribosomal-protein-alanine N-acetyltransferase